MASDCTDEEQALTDPFTRAPDRTGRPREWPTGTKVEAVRRKIDGQAVEIGERPEDIAGVVVTPRSAHAWLSHCSRPAEEWEAALASVNAWRFVASVRPTAGA